jgi:hypothetical protein
MSKHGKSKNAAIRKYNETVERANETLGTIHFKFVSPEVVHTKTSWFWKEALDVMPPETTSGKNPIPYEQSIEVIELSEMTERALEEAMHTLDCMKSFILHHSMKIESLKRKIDEKDWEQFGQAADYRMRCAAEYLVKKNIANLEKERESMIQMLSVASRKLGE